MFQVGPNDVLSWDFQWLRKMRTDTHRQTRFMFLKFISNSPMHIQSYEFTNLRMMMKYRLTTQGTHLHFKLLTSKHECVDLIPDFCESQTIAVLIPGGQQDIKEIQVTGLAGAFFFLQFRIKSNFLLLLRIFKRDKIS